MRGSESTVGVRDLRHRLQADKEVRLGERLLGNGRATTGHLLEKFSSPGVFHLPAPSSKPAQGRALGFSWEHVHVLRLVAFVDAIGDTKSKAPCCVVAYDVRPRTTHERTLGKRDRIQKGHDALKRLWWEAADGCLEVAGRARDTGCEATMSYLTIANPECINLPQRNRVSELVAGKPFPFGLFGAQCSAFSLAFALCAVGGIAARPALSVEKALGEVVRAAFEASDDLFRGSLRLFGTLLKVSMLGLCAVCVDLCAYRVVVL